jgi:hypothetical protein
MNKLLIKLSGVLAIAFSIVNLFTYVGIHFAIPYTVLSDNLYVYFIFLIIAILSYICLVGGMVFVHYKDLNDKEFSEKKQYIFIWSSFFIFFCPISGVLGFLSYYISFKPISSSEISYVNELKELEKLLKDGLITEKEFNLKKNKILNI